MALSLVTGPSLEPLTITEAKRNARAPLDITDEDGLFASWITTMREHVENATNRALLTQTWALTLDHFGCSDYMRHGKLYLPKPPVTSVTSIVYLDTAGVSQTWGTSNYRTHFPSGPHADKATIEPAYGVNWPQTYGVSNAVTVTFVAGYGSVPEAVPSTLVDYMKARITDMWEQRGTLAVGVGIGALVIPSHMDSQLWAYKDFS